MTDNPGRGKRLLILAAAFAAAGILLFVGFSGGTPGGKAGEDAATPSAIAVKPAPVTLSIVCVGDTMVHRPQIASQYEPESKTYDYRNNFEYVKAYIEEADLALCNVETTFAGGTPTGYPSFNAPDALADALADTGFDVAITSNNHLLDKGLDAVGRTLRVLREAGLATSGTQTDGEPNYTMVEAQGVPIAVVAYTYETPSIDGRPAINSAPLPAEAEPMINSFSYDDLDNDLGEIAETIRAAKENGAKIVLCYYHWGQEYQRIPDDWEEYIAAKTADMGADVLFASHPHVLQKIGMATGEETGREIPVFYSMGNFLSNQRYETLSNRYTEQGMIAAVELEYDEETETVTLLSTRAMGTWMEKYHAGGKDIYRVIPLDNTFENNETLAASGHIGRARQALADITETLGTAYLWQ